eukprot:Em0001g3307a
MLRGNFQGASKYKYACICHKLVSFSAMPARQCDVDEYNRLESQNPCNVHAIVDTSIQFVCAKEIPVEKKSRIQFKDAVIVVLRENRKLTKTLVRLATQSGLFAVGCKIAIKKAFSTSVKGASKLVKASSPVSFVSDLAQDYYQSDWRCHVTGEETVKCPFTPELVVLGHVAPEQPFPLGQVTSDADASVLLNKFNTGDGQGKVWDGYCLAHLFTYWVLSNGLLGLCNIASPSATTTGGICSTKCWGSYHDPATTPSCSNVFIMNQYAQDGSQPTHKMFSNCSRTSIGAVLSAKAQNCFTVHGTGVCGDYVVTSGEQCDAGLLGDTCWTDACQLRSTAMCRSLPVFLHWIPTFNIHHCNKNGGGHQGTLDYTMTMWKTMLKRCGKAIDELSMRQRKRQLEAIKGNTVKALSFTESYGLTADTLTMHTASAWGMSNFVPACSPFLLRLWFVACLRVMLTTNLMYPDPRISPYVAYTPGVQESLVAKFFGVPRTAIQQIRDATEQNMG